MDELALLMDYKYAILSLLALIEGPVLSLLCGFLVRLGYLYWLPTILILIAGDIASDTIYYFLSLKGHGERYVERYGKKYKTISENFSLLKNLWERHGFITMFLGKFAYGLTVPLVVSAAISRVSYKKMLAYTIPPTAVKYSLLMAIGYYLGYSYKSAEKYIYLSVIYIPAIILLFILSYRLILKYLKHKAGK
jgi:membrane protein DedA with SNARE-associated domain